MNDERTQTHRNRHRHAAKQTAGQPHEQTDRQKTKMSIHMHMQIHIHKCSIQVKTSLFVSTDLKLVELAIDGSSSILMKIANNFAQKCSVPGKMFFEIDNVLRELQRCHEASLWCKFKDIGGERPVVDAGIHLHSEISWRLADVLMPQVDDEDGHVTSQSTNKSSAATTHRIKTTQTDFNQILSHHFHRQRQSQTNTIEGRGYSGRQTPSADSRGWMLSELLRIAAKQHRFGACSFIGSFRDQSRKRHHGYRGRWRSGRTSRFNSHAAVILTV